MVHHYVRDGGRQSDGGGDQGLGDTGRHGLDARRGGGGEPAKGGHDAPDGAEEPDEWRRARRRGEEGETALQPRDLLRPGAVHCTLHVLDAAELDRVFVTTGVAALALREPLQLLIAAAEHLRDGALLQIHAGG